LKVHAFTSAYHLLAQGILGERMPNSNRYSEYSARGVALCRIRTAPQFLALLTAAHDRKATFFATFALQTLHFSIKATTYSSPESP
jgi:hypothetical protein